MKEIDNFYRKDWIDTKKDEIQTKKLERKQKKLEKQDQFKSRRKDEKKDKVKIKFTLRCTIILFKIFFLGISSFMKCIIKTFFQNFCHAHVK